MTTTALLTNIKEITRDSTFIYYYTSTHDSKYKLVIRNVTSRLGNLAFAFPSSASATTSIGEAK